eukprot:3390813-Pleurochrysis_carterae.AAC.3
MSVHLPETGKLLGAPANFVVQFFGMAGDFYGFCFALHGTLLGPIPYGWMPVPAKMHRRI